MIDIDIPLINAYNFGYVKMRGAPHHRLFDNETNALIDFWDNGTVYYPIGGKKGSCEDMESILLLARKWLA